MKLAERRKQTMRKGLFNWPKQLEPANPSFNSFLWDMRAAYGMEVYEEINPYIAVFRMRENMWALFAPCTHMMGDNWIYLIEGPEKAIFIDNGFGIGDLKGLGEFLTGKPVITAVTHNHGDHAYGSVQWDKIYCHDYCAQMLEFKQENGWEREWLRFNHVNKPESYRPYFKTEDVMPFKPFECVHLQNHDLINLGEDYDIEIIHMGGHGPGNSVFLDKKARILYSGDSILETRDNPSHGAGIHGKTRPWEPLHPECMGISFYSRQIAKLVKRVGEFDYVMAGHGYTESPSRIVNDMYKATMAVLEDPYSYDACFPGRHGENYVKGGGPGSIASIVYSPDDVIENLQRYPLESWDE